MFPLLIPAIVELVKFGIQQAAQNNNNALQPQDAPAVERQVTQTVIDGLQNNPTIQHLTNSEPWYQSRVTWGALIAMAAGTLGLAGVAVDDYDQQMLINVAIAVGAIVSSCVTLYGRWKAKRPLGT